MNILYDNPIIAAVRKEEEFLRALERTPEIIFLLSSDIISLGGFVQRAHAKGKTLFIHTDFCGGLSADKYGLQYIKQAGADGIISTRTGTIGHARELGIKTVQRFFIIDSQSVHTALDTVKFSRPDMIELMPGVLSQAVAKFIANVKIPVIAGGLIESKQQIMDALSAGAAAVSTASEKLWEV